MRFVSEAEFRERLAIVLLCARRRLRRVGSVTGPGRSGAIAAVYVSHQLGVPFVPFGVRAPLELGPVLIVDTAMESGRTMRKAARKYAMDHGAGAPISLVFYREPPRVAFWYEADKPQAYRHERRAA